MPKSVGILTLHYAFNFGAVLQAYALQRTLGRLGSSGTIVDYRPSEHHSEYAWLRFSRTRVALRHNYLTIRFLGDQFRLRKRFEFFIARHLRLTPARFHTLADLNAASPLFEAYIAGSDQIWHPGLLNSERGQAYFLGFGSGARRIAYAPSFGLEQVPPEHQPFVREMLMSFDFLSAREEAGCNIIRTLIGREPEHVLDPTLLLSAADYPAVESDVSPSKPFLLFYPMENNEHLGVIAAAASRLLGLPLVAVLPIQFDPSRFRFADRVVHDAGPGEFLELMRNCAWVLTNSFHGTCFAIINRKPFLNIAHSRTNSRSLGLLKQLGLQDRQVLSDDSDNFRRLCQAPVDYAPAERHLSGRVEQSLDYLRRALS